MPLYIGRRRRVVRRLLKPRYFIDPEANAKRMWDLLLTGLVLYTTLVVPYRVCFQVEAAGGFAILETSMDVAFFVDIVLNFVTGLQLPSGEVSYNFRVIVKAYLRGWFVVDFARLFRSSRLPNSLEWGTTLTLLCYQRSCSVDLRYFGCSSSRASAVSAKFSRISRMPSTPTRVVCR